MASVLFSLDGAVSKLVMLTAACEPEWQLFLALALALVAQTAAFGRRREYENSSGVRRVLYRLNILSHT